MANPWLALDAGADPVERIRQVGRAHERFVAGEAPRGASMRSVVADSWRRSAVALPGPDATAPIELSDDDLETYRAAHPLASVLPIFRDLLGGLAEDGEHLMAVCDAYGRLLWVEGTAKTLRAGERMNFVPGARWDEAHAGTNAPGTALAVDHPLQIFATEHFSRGVQRWTCAAAPIHDPGTGRLLGAIDVTGGDHLANPHSLALVRATALAAEAFLSSHRPSPATAGSVSALGRNEVVLTFEGRQWRLGRRHSELLVLLLAHPEGSTGDELGVGLYGDEASPVTVRAELSRLRRMLGPELMESRPYRLRAEIQADFRTVPQLLEQGRVADALEAYAGPLLPFSDAPGVVKLRRLVDGRLRSAVLTARDRGLLQTWLHSPWGSDDLEIWEAYAHLLSPTDPARPMAAARIQELQLEYGLATSLQRSGN
ncbi:GAF domain-containing protein [Actinoplanes bogorensis]|uniref:GAF domain-containing protein n=1 Tax=Paractinoplanes bogorensis TaxID=1610840 RepID=A0ABS5Z425_9ACTN|nr:GAF domain-containing protein [Actinoplanes bogorensis]MBU2670433.1 GAF domain-containing protein [Actinoplanes bogorensis]